MYKLFLFLNLLLLTYVTNGQAPFQKISFSKALKKAAKENKLIFLQYESGNCVQCNEVADKAFSDKNLQEKISKSFIPVKINPSDKDRQDIAGLFNLKAGFATLYIDKDKNLVHKTTFTSSSPLKYYAEMELAFKKQKALEEIKENENEYFGGNKKDIATIKRIIQNKTELGQDIGLLLLEYVNLLPKDSLNSIEVLQFIAKQSPVLHSKPDSILRNSKNFNIAWYGIPLKDRIEINGRTISKSLRLAAENRDENKAIAIAWFTKGTYENQEEGRNAYDLTMLKYYLFSKDTARYLALASQYYDKLFAKITPEYLETADSINRARAFTKEPGKTATGSDFVNAKRGVSFVNARSEYGNQMQNTAERFYHLDKENKYTDFYTRWIERSLTLNRNPNNLHLYALILYKDSKKEEAIKRETEAIDLSRAMGSERKEWKKYIESMEKGENLDGIEY